MGLDEWTCPLISLCAPKISDSVRGSGEFLGVGSITVVLFSAVLEPPFRPRAGSPFI